jgi:hypothetical protein
MDTTQGLPRDPEPPPVFPRIDRIETAVREAAPQWSREQAGSSRPRFAAPGAERLHAASIAGALLATLVLGCLAGWSQHGFFSADPPSPPLEHNSSASARVSNPVEASTAAGPKPDRGATPHEPNGRRVATAAGRDGRRESPTEAARQEIPSTMPSSSPARQDTSAPKRAPSLVNGRTIAPVPETRPITVPGWMIRDVAGTTATLEGPNGVWRTTPGATVPGVGRVHFIVRWGGRWMVGTSKGLITTP